MMASNSTGHDTNDRVTQSNLLFSTEERNAEYDG